ncbi:MAG: hypothetical protein OXE55_06215 [Flavobacteriaceae bacterium]|nr:hypothetical protein [Flavobacteriaceae bacterium]
MNALKKSNFMIQFGAENASKEAFVLRVESNYFGENLNKKKEFFLKKLYSIERQINTIES